MSDLHCLRIIETLHGSEDSLDPQEKAFAIKISRLVEGEGWFGSERDIIVVSFMRSLRNLAVGEGALEETWCRYMRTEYYACLCEAREKRERLAGQDMGLS
ncbi:hypothetical protein IFM53868_03300 [Aspergillus udagawae]|uniref:Uncharacterized protein n=1 Tax=Aspergillus udagawae TaxID=91492 RepID=A0ABQ1AHE1_9EURO|nr:hypothetical protein IFM53868_03300 [Aspergillus udagawae]